MASRQQKVTKCHHLLDGHQVATWRQQKSSRSGVKCKRLLKSKIRPETLKSQCNFPPAEGASSWRAQSVPPPSPSLRLHSAFRGWREETSQCHTDRRLTVHRSHSRRLIRCLSCGRRDKGSGGSSSPEWSSQDSSTARGGRESTQRPS